MDMESYVLGSSFTTQEITKVNQSITNVTNQVISVTSGIKSVSVLGSQLTFTLNDDSTISTTLTGLSDNNYSTMEKNKLSSLNSYILTKFTYDGTQLLFDGEPIANSTVDLSNYYNKTEVDNLLTTKANSSHNHMLSDITDILLTSLLDGQTIIYDSASGKFVNGNIATDGTIKMDSSSSLDYLNNLIDETTIQNSSGKLVAKSLDGLTVDVTTINYLTGLNQNLMTLIGSLTNPMTMLGVFDTYALLIADTSAVNGSTAIVKTDENNSGAQMMYLYIGTGTYNSSNWEAVSQSNIEVRNFITNPIILGTETSGTLPQSQIDLTGIVKAIDLNNYLDKSTYDSNSNGIVDKAETLDGLTKTVTEINSAVDKANTIVTTGDGTKFKSDDGTYKTISLTVSGGTTINHWISGASYAVDKLVIFDNKLYQCTTANSDETFIVENWNLIGGSDNISIDDTIISTETTYSSNKIDSLITEVNNTNFTNANNAKAVTINAIGDTALTTSNTFVEISNSLLAKKQNIVNALVDKGIITATQSDDIADYAIDINNIVQNSQIKNTKLNKLAGETYQVVLTNPTTVQNISTSVLEYQAGATGVVQYNCDFNNGDSTSFNTTTDQHLIFDGTMHQDNNIQTITMTNEGTIDTYTIYSVPLDKTGFYKINNITEATVDTNEVLTISGTYNPILVQANNDISLLGVDRISDITWTATTTNDSKLILIYSIDSGITWKGYDSVNHLVLDITSINDLNEVKAKGITIANLNAFTQTDLDNIRNDSPKIRFAYYLEKNSISDTLQNDKITLTVDMIGEDVFSTHYSIIFDNIKTLTYTFSQDGTYTIIYTDNN